MFLKNKNIIFKIRRSKVTDYAALMCSTVACVIFFLNFSDQGMFIVTRALLLSKYLCSKKNTA